MSLKTCLPSWRSPYFLWGLCVTVAEHSPIWPCHFHFLLISAVLEILLEGSSEKPWSKRDQLVSDTTAWCRWLCFTTQVLDGKNIYIFTYPKNTHYVFFTCVNNIWSEHPTDWELFISAKNEEYFHEDRVFYNKLRSSTINSIKFIYNETWL